MLIDKNKEYQVGSYTYRNFVDLSLDEKLMILRERNHPDVKKWMFTNEDISVENHLAFIEGLTTRNDAFYWLMEYEKKPVGVLNIIHCDFEKSEGEPGYYLFASEQNSGNGLEMQYCYKKLFFDIFGVKNLIGHVLYGNTDAYQMSCFYGAETIGEIIQDGRKYLVVQTSSENFKKILPSRLALQYIKYIKSNPVLWE